MRQEMCPLKDLPPLPSGKPLNARRPSAVTAPGTRFPSRATGRLGYQEIRMMPRGMSASPRYPFSKGRLTLAQAPCLRLIMMYGDKHGAFPGEQLSGKFPTPSLGPGQRIPHPQSLAFNLHQQATQGLHLPRTRRAFTPAPVFPFPSGLRTPFPSTVTSTNLRALQLESHRR